jgi:hypothetical protein
MTVRATAKGIRSGAAERRIPTAAVAEVHHDLGTVTLFWRKEAVRATAERFCSTLGVNDSAAPPPRIHSVSGARPDRSSCDSCHGAISLDLLGLWVL